VCEEAVPLKSSRWTLAALALLIAGSATSIVAADGSAHSRTATAREAFDAGTADVASRLRLTIEREQDLAVSAAADLQGHPTTMRESLAAWVHEVQLFDRYPELQGMGAVVIVAPDQLPAGVTVIPAGHRDLYCLAVAGAARPGTVELPAGMDFCAGPLRQVLLLSRDRGVGTYDPIDLEGTEWLGVETPFFRHGAKTKTVADRRSALLGWLGMSVDPTVVLKGALAGHPELGVTLRQTTGATPVVFRSGERHGSGRQRSVTVLSEGWQVETVGPRLPGGVLAGGVPLMVLIGGLAITVLLAVVVLLLGTGRARALRLVGEKTDELRYQALHDSLTGLPNRALFTDRVEQAIARAQRSQAPLAVMFLDLDNFKAVNDTYGHQAGDRLLKAVGARLKTALRDTDTVARFGGDEFVALVESDFLELGVEAVAERIQAVLAEPVTLDEAGKITVRSHASIGIAVGSRASAEDLLRDADVALYEAKAAGKDCFITFQPEMQRAVVDRLELEMDLREALADRQLFLVYQPTVDLHTQEITGVEALLRWQHPTRGLVTPDVFIPIAEDSGLIVPIGRWVLQQACHQGADWARAGRPLRLAVNVSARQLDAQHDFVADVAELLAESGLPADLLTLEITETMLMRDAGHSTARLGALKELGVKVAIDDFGTGYCSLAYLQQFPVDALKIDRSFISSLDSTPEALALVHTLVQLGKTLGLETYAEGIEEHSQLEQLKSESCDSGQGYLFARPMSLQALDELIGDRSLIPRQTRGLDVPTA
jgi:diguanylate cyclase (GGDEF)-like protein